MASLHIETRKPNEGGSDLPPVLLVHGAWHGAWCWQDNFLEYFAQNGFETHAIDLRGHGHSVAVKSMRWNRISDYVDDVLSFVEGHERPPFVIGHSMGGFVSQHLMRRTNRLSGVGLLATVPHYGAIKVTSNIILRRPLDFAKVNLFLSLYPLVSDPMKAKAMFLDSDVSDMWAREFGAKLIDESYLGFLDMLCLNLPRGPVRDLPVKVVGGELDHLFPPETQHATAKSYGVEAEIIPDAPHDLMQSKHWEAAAAAFLKWMRAENQS